jgi:putative colanic acid biosynthesis acetyltransferase WcaF
MRKVDLRKSTVAWGAAMLLRRGLWHMVWSLVKWLPKPLSCLRIQALRYFGAHIGKHCLILPGVRVLMPWNLDMGDCVAIGASVNLYNFAKIVIGPMTLISQNSFLCTGSHDYCLSDMPLTYSPILIGSECWIAADVFVGPGVCIENGVVVGARSVVIKSIDAPWTVHGGFPARLLKPRLMREVGR